MKKLLAMGAVLAALTSSVQAQYNESAVTGPGGGLVMAREGTSVRWTVTGSPSDVIWLEAPDPAVPYLIPNSFERLENVRLGILDARQGIRQIIVEAIQYLPNNQIRVSLRHDPTKLVRLPSGQISRQYQRELVGGNVQLRTAGSAIIDSDPVQGAGSVY